MATASTTTYKHVTQVNNQDNLILENVDFVARILSTMTFMVTSDEARENLHSAGVLGLVEAAHSFDANQGIAFRTFAYPRIRGAIVDELRKQSPVSQAVLKQIGVVKKAYESIEPPVTSEALADATGLNVDQIVDCLEAMRFIKPDNWNDLSDVIHGSWRSSVDSPEYQLESEEMTRVLAESIQELSDQQRIVLSLYYTEELKLAEIAAAMDLSESRVSRILAAAKFRLQEMIRCKTA
ncbi:MAG: sigma-70 family RNA polymerase sigma factor [Pirellulaceae bacterium]|nr:sigma-70 family RNA polymerase sigma factor [Pirellulaceae bacterium]